MSHDESQCSPPHRTSGRHAEWSREQIVRTAMAIADEEGLVSASTRRVAAELGTGAASLYRHVTNRAELVDLMVDTALGEYAPPRPVGGWRAALVDEHVARMRYMRSRPWLIDAMMERPPAGRSALRVLEHFLELVQGHPASAGSKLEAFGVLAGVIQTYLHSERLSGGILDPEFVETRAENVVRAAADGSHPRLAEAFDALNVASSLAATEEAAQVLEAPDEQLARVIGLVLDGLLQVGTRSEEPDIIGT